MPVIVISGKPGCGSSTVAKILAKKLGLGHFSVGDYNKGHSQEKRETDRSLEMWKGLGSGKKFHIDSDRLARSMAKKGNMVIDGKIGLHMLKGLYNYGIWLTAPQPIRIRRYAKRDNMSIHNAREKLREKEFLERKNWKKIYDFDYFNQEKGADIIINTGNKMPEEIVDSIISKIRRVFIVHRWAATPKSDWYPYAKAELEKKGYFVNILKMQGTSRPQLSKWLPNLTKAIVTPSPNTFLVGHSAGVATILHYLAHLKKGEKIGGCVLVAGWTDDLGYKQLSSFVEKPFDWDKIRKHCTNFIAIHSDNDPYVKMHHGKAFKKKLHAKLVIEHNKGHMDDDSKTKKLPSVVKAIGNMAK